jgi:hypothetical protein
LKKPNIKFDPKAILGFLKKRWSLLLSVLVLLTAVPLSLFFSLGMSKAVHDEVQKAVDADLGEIGSKGASAKVQYTLPAASPGGQAVEVSFAPNEKLINTFAELHKKQAEELKGVVKVVGGFSGQRVAIEGSEFRREERKPLLEGFFPEPTENDRIKRSEFQRLLTPAYTQLLQRYRAGGPPSPEDVGARLQEYRAQRIQALAGPGATDINALNTDDQVRLKEELINFRVGRYEDRAKQLLFYAELPMFNLPPEDPTDPPAIDQCWEWQHKYWIHEDILAAAALANLSAANEGIPAAPVKRIESITIDEFLWSESGDGSSAFNGVPLDKRMTITGRVGTTANELYEARPVTIVAVLAGDGVNRFIEALAKTNFMSVLDIDTVSIDPVTDLAGGYFYGHKHLVRATIRIETIWLRSWLKPTMPLSVKRALQLEPPDPNAPPDILGAGNRRTGAAGPGGGGRSGSGG